MTRSLSLLLLLLLLASCRGSSPRVSLALPEAPRPLARELIAVEVGRLLSADAAASRAAEERLTTLDLEGRTALLRHAERIPDEKDPRWFLVLEENHALPPLPPQDEIQYLVWKAQKREMFYVMKAQSRLLDLARSHPDEMLSALEAPQGGADVLSVALSLAHELKAFVPLRDRYAEAKTPEERRVAAEALTQLTGGDVKPRVLGSPTDITADVARLDAWWGEHQAGGS